MNHNGTKLGLAAQRYLELKRSLGRTYDHEEWILVSLQKHLAASDHEDLDQDLFASWCESPAALTANVRRNRQRVVRNFCLYRQRNEQECFVPDASRFPRPRPHAAPIIFGPTEVARMLAATERMTRTPNSPLRPEVLRLAVVLLYTAGLRRGELLKLSLADTDSELGVLQIRESKFRKSRMVPLSSDAHAELRAYLTKRLELPSSTSPEAPLLCNYSRGLRGYTGTGLSRGVHELFETANVHGPDGRRPRLHDFRHSFAVQALLRWYKQGADVQSNLPKLALYMGHVSIVSTAYYLKLIPEIAIAASDLYCAHLGHLITKTPHDT